MSSEQSLALADFARTCKAAARAVSLYPSTHPSIQSSLARTLASAQRLGGGADVTLTVHPDQIVIEGKAPARPDVAVGELAAMFHERLIGALRIEREAGAEDWLALLLLLSRPVEDVLAAGGIGKAWSAAGRGHFEIREIDYAEVLRERGGGGQPAEWGQIIAQCLQGNAAALDDRALASMLDTFADSARLRAFVDAMQTATAGAGVTIGARAAALLQLLRRTLEASAARGPQETDRIVKAVAEVAPQLTPDLMLGLAGEPAVVAQMGDAGVASFVANAVIAERGATERLAQAFQALVPENERKQRLLDLARDEAAATPLGGEAGFEDLWQSAASMLTSYSDRNFVSNEYGRELSSARTQAIEVDRVSDDPPERVQDWLSTVSDSAVRQLDLTLLLDLLRIEEDEALWQALAAVAVVEIERRTLLGEIGDALQLATALVGRGGAETAFTKLAAGPLVRHIVLYLRKADEADATPLNQLCHTVGARIAKPLAEALAVEDNDRAIRRLRELLLGFGAAGRQSVEQLKNSPKPAVRRMAIDLLRVFGGREALPELASMLDDADPQVQRESIRAIVQIGTPEAYAILERALAAGSRSHDTVVQELIELRDDKAIPLLCYVLNHSTPRGKLVQVHTQIIDALGALSVHPESTRTLRTVLYRGEWWAPYRTAALRRAAASALRRIGKEETAAVLEEAGARGSRGVRAAVRPHLGAGIRRERPRS
jgi:hypothetical protein